MTHPPGSPTDPTLGQTLGWAGRRAWLVPVALCILGAALRLWQYGVGASLWADEANMVLNIEDRPVSRLLGPLDFRQMAPPGWLLLVKAAVTLFGEGEHALRLVPLLGSLATLPLCWHVARQVLPPGIGRTLALGLVAIGGPFIFFAAQVKPYATDVAVALGLLALALAVRRDGPGGGRMVRLGLVGAIAPWFSYPAILVDAGLLAALGLAAIVGRDRERLRALLPVAITWAASIVATVAWARTTVTPDDALYMQRFWARSLMPWPPQSLQDLGWPVSRLTTVYGGGGLRYPAPGIFLVLAAIGAWALWRRARDLAWLLLGPILATFGAAALRVYPFAPRLVLFLFPVFLLLTAAGVEAMGTVARGARWGRAGERRAVGIAAARVRPTRRHRPRRDPPPYAPEPLKPALERDAGCLAARRPRLRLLRRGEGVRLLRAALWLRARLVPPGALRPRGPPPLPPRVGRVPRGARACGS